MNEDKFTELVIKITSELSSLNANMKTVLDNLKNHEERLNNLEKKTDTSNSLSNIVPWLVKGLLIALGIIATLSGSGAILKTILTN